MSRDVDIVRARIAWEFLMLPYVTRAALLQEFGFPGKEPHTELLPEAMDTLTSEGRLDAFRERVSELYGKQTEKNGNGGVCGLFANTLGARMARGENPGAERMDELRKAAEPLRKYLMKYGDPHTRVAVTLYDATETRDERRVLFREETLAEQEAKP